MLKYKAIANLSTLRRKDFSNILASMMPKCVANTLGLMPTNTDISPDLSNRIDNYMGFVKDGVDSGDYCKDIHLTLIGLNMKYYKEVDKYFNDNMQQIAKDHGFGYHVFDLGLNHHGAYTKAIEADEAAMVKGNCCVFKLKESQLEDNRIDSPSTLSLLNDLRGALAALNGGTYTAPLEPYREVILNAMEYFLTNDTKYRQLNSDSWKKAEELIELMN